MITPQRIWNNWKLNREHGDVKKIHEATVEAGNPISEVTIGNAIRTGRANKATIKAINDFYTNKPAQKKADEKKLIEELEAE